MPDNILKGRRPGDRPAGAVEPRAGLLDACHRSRYTPDPVLKRFLVATVAIVLAIGHAVAQDVSQPAADSSAGGDSYVLGDQMLALGASLVWPLFTYLPTDQVAGSSLTGTNLSPGGKLSLNWNAFLGPRLTIGAEVGGMFAIDRHGEPLLMVPVTGRLGYQFSSELFGLGQFDLPVFVNAGVGFMKLADLFNMNVVLRPGASVFYRYDRNWSFGGSVSVWLMFEPLWGAASTDSSAGLATFLDFSPQIVYHF